MKSFFKAPHHLCVHGEHEELGNGYSVCHCVNTV